jgi:hypothetical protein
MKRTPMLLATPLRRVSLEPPTYYLLQMTSMFFMAPSLVVGWRSDQHSCAMLCQIKRDGVKGSAISIAICQL